jgi:hypothetical protein
MSDQQLDTVARRLDYAEALDKLVIRYIELADELRQVKRQRDDYMQAVKNFQDAHAIALNERDAARALLVANGIEVP